MSFVARFAPSPTGPLHLGHAFSAMTANDMARRHSGTFLLRIEDIDRTRARDHWERQIEDDLHWLGLDWPRPVLRQSERSEVYGAALDRLTRAGLTYACRCNRRDIIEAARAPQEGASRHGPDGPIYPGTCKRAGHPPKGAAIRLHMDRALEVAGDVSFEETAFGGQTHWPRTHIESAVGDVVLARRGWATSYHLSVVIDDAAQGVTHVTRGADLFDATPIHVVLQRILGLATPIYHHHRLIRDETGRRLAKRDDARAISVYRDAGRTPGDIRAMVGL